MNNPNEQVTIPDFSTMPSFADNIETGMSNLDNEIQEGFEQHLRNNGWGRHAAWNFNGLVWFKDNKFHEQVWRYGSPIKVISSDSLRELMDEVNSEFGWD